MKWVRCVLLGATICVGFLVEPRAEPAQSVALRCRCKGRFTATSYAHPCIASVTSTGSVTDGRCHKPPPSICDLTEQPCIAKVSWTITAEDGCTPDFRWSVGSAVQPTGGPSSVFRGSHSAVLYCGWFDQFVTITADGATVLTFILECDDCSG